MIIDLRCKSPNKANQHGSELPPLMWTPLLTRRGGKCQNTTSQERPGNIQKTSKLKQ